METNTKWHPGRISETSDRIYEEMSIAIHGQLTVLTTSSVQVETLNKLLDKLLGKKLEKYSNTPEIFRSLVQ